MIDAKTVDPMPDSEPDSGFWSQTDELIHIHSFARSRRVSPYATLGCVLRRATACVEPHVVLPPTIGGYVSVNLYTTSAGVSGQGKGAADAAGSAAVYFHDDSANDLDADRPSIGSGEGLARVFSGGKGQPGTTRANLIVPEVKTLEALMGRQGSTLVGELLKGYMGEPLGFSNAQRETTTAVGAHTYRLCMGIGVQPENAGFFLSREKDGFPQRFLWLPTDDPYAPEERPEPVDQLNVLVPTFNANRDDWHEVQIPGSARDDIDAHRHRVLVGDPDIDPLDGHLMLTRLKVAFALAVLHGRSTVGENEWKIADSLIDMSVRVREQMRVTVDAARRRQNTAKAHDQADRETIIQARLSEDAQQRTARIVTRKLKHVGDEGATRRDLQQACHSSLRDVFPTVFDLFIDKKFVVPVGGEKFAMRYRLNTDDEGG